MLINSLLMVVIEHPGYTGVGIDESTAILVEGNQTGVFGESQVILIRNPNDSVRKKDGLLAAQYLLLGVYIPGETFYLE